MAILTVYELNFMMYDEVSIMGKQLKGVLMATKQNGDRDYRVSILGKTYSAKEFNQIYKWLKRTAHTKLQIKFRKSMFQALKFSEQVEEENE